ncbi:MAG: sigma-70 family RNA polymerase sigma factor, partial [Clostridia bacterium]|nr:sigma-70 family RNA polymerase sigma factor [Clostridia bacterium]
EIKRFLRDDGIVKVSRSLKELSLKVYRLRQNPKFAEASVSELAGALGCGAEEVAYAIKSTSAVSSLDELSENGAAISEKTDSFDDADNRIIIKHLLAELSEEDRKIVILRYFRQKTQSETAKLIGVSQVQISRREKKILQNLRDISYK